jgi:type IV secretion system protein VirB9
MRIIRFLLRRSTCALAVLSLGACSTYKPPQIAYDNTPKPAVLQPDPPKPVQVVELPKLLPLPDQLKPLPAMDDGPVEPSDPAARVAAANAAARIQPSRASYINAIEVWPFSDGALYQVLTAPGEITDIGLEPGEQLIGTGPVATGDSARWVIGDTDSGSGTGKRVHILVKPVATGLKNDLVINTDRRTYHLELRSTPETYMAGISWSYPQDQLIALHAQDRAADKAAPIASDIDVNALQFRYRIEGDNPPWKPVRAFDDGKKVYIEFPTAIAQGQMPPLFVIGPSGGTDLVNYRVHGNHMVVDQLFGAAELTMGDADSQQKVRIVRTDGKPK